MSQAAKLTLSGDTLAVVTTSAELAMWDLANATCVIRPLCFRSLLSQGGNVLHFIFIKMIILCWVFNNNTCSESPAQFNNHMHLEKAK